MKNAKKKGFTLVELLVVIAILAILASVSVVGYTAFIDKANESNARTELTQIRDFINAKFLPSNAFEVEVGTDTYTFSKQDGKLIISDSNGQTPDQQTITAIFHAIPEFASLNADVQFASEDNGAKIVYTLGKTRATWNVTDGTIETTTIN
ncbi:MAG: prepilin-type N-terminal cleavage/methylation domain-containing protein [Clostridia bacterium]|nr:prepilin-type N-terminal cleavage/methylation domain-containing protein [Clostridia bacterium]